MQELFVRFLEKPSLEKFLEIRKNIIQSDRYFPYSKEISDMSNCLEEKEYATAREIFLNTFPNLLLCPSAHLMLSYVYKGQGNEKLAEFEEHVMLLLVHFIMQTGDGTES